MGAADLEREIKRINLASEKNVSHRRVKIRIPAKLFRELKTKVYSNVASTCELLGIFHLLGPWDDTY